MECATMNLTTVENEQGHITVVNSEQVTYLRQDGYGTSIHFTSGEYIVCPKDMDYVIARLRDEAAPESLLLKSN
jgi:hypothetical protein